MDDKEAYLAQMQAERGYLMDWHKLLADHDLEFLKAYNNLLANTYTSPRLLDDRTKELLLTAVLVAVRSTPDHIETHLKKLKAMGVSAAEVLEMLELLLPPAGLPPFFQALELWRKIYEVG